MAVDAASKVGTLGDREQRRRDVPFHRALLTHVDLFGRGDGAGDLPEHDDCFGADLALYLTGWSHREHMLT